MLFFLAFLCLLPTCMSQVVFPKPCPMPPLQINFTLTAYMGKWYQASGYPFTFSENGKCITAEYVQQEDGSIQVNNTMFDINQGVFRSDIGTATVPDPDQPAQLCVVFYEEPTCGDYRVLRTNYDDYSLVFACGGLSFTSVQVGWILTRQANPDPAIVQDLIDYAESVGISGEPWTPTLQDCGN